MALLQWPKSKVLLARRIASGGADRKITYSKLYGKNI
jgi:hypothetical protein